MCTLRSSVQKSSNSLWWDQFHVSKATRLHLRLVCVSKPLQSQTLNEMVTLRFLDINKLQSAMITFVFPLLITVSLFTSANCYISSASQSLRGKNHYQLLEIYYSYCQNLTISILLNVIQWQLFTRKFCQKPATEIQQACIQHA